MRGEGQGLGAGVGAARHVGNGEQDFELGAVLRGAVDGDAAGVVHDRLRGREAEEAGAGAGWFRGEVGIEDLLRMSGDIPMPESRTRSRAKSRPSAVA